MKANKKYPFIFLNHGPFEEPSNIDKCEELYIWFAREVKEEEQLEIQKNCPPPLAGFFNWADVFTHFGSEGDVYDSIILYNYSSNEENKNLSDFKNFDSNYYYSILERNANIFVQELEKWILQVHEIVPILFFIGPHGAGGSEWDDWSQAQVTQSILPALHDYLSKNPDLVIQADQNLNDLYDDSEYSYEEDYQGEDEMEEFEFDLDAEFESSGLIMPVRRSQMRKEHIASILPYIMDYVLGYIEVRDSSSSQYLLDFVIRKYDFDGIFDEVETLTFEQSRLESNADLITKALQIYQGKDWWEQFGKLPSYIQLSYLASFESAAETTSGGKKKKNGRDHLITSLEKPVEYIQKLISTLPENRTKVYPSLLVRMAENLVLIGPAFYNSKGDKTHSQLAKELLEMAIQSGYAPESVYINAAAFCDWSGDYERMLELSLESVKLYPDNTTILTNIIYAAQKTGRKDIENEYAEKSMELSLTDPNLLLNQLHNLISNGREADAHQLFQRYKEKGNTPTPEIYHNMLVIYIHRPEEAGELLEEIVGLYQKGGSKYFKSYEHLMNNVTYILNELQRYKESYKLLQIYRKNKGNMTPSIYCAEIYTTICLKDAKKQSKTKKEMLEFFQKHPTYFDREPANYYNMACVAALEGNQAEALMFAKLTKERGYASFEDMRTDEHLKLIWEEAEFKALFE